MKQSNKITGLLVLLSTLMLTACDASKESAVSEPVAGESSAPAAGEASNEASDPTVEAAAVVVESGGAKAAVVVEKSTEASDTIFVASTLAKSLTGKVAFINHETRDVVLVGEKGVELKLVASEETKNLDQVAVGDTVNVKHIQRITAQLVEGQDLKPAVAKLSVKKQAKEGELPAMLKTETRVKIYTIEAINLEQKTFSLKNVDGTIREFTAKDPKRLERASIGDSVKVTVVAALAVEVVKAGME